MMTAIITGRNQAAEHLQTAAAGTSFWPLVWVWCWVSITLMMKTEPDTRTHSLNVSAFNFLVMTYQNRKCGKGPQDRSVGVWAELPGRPGSACSWAETHRLWSKTETFRDHLSSLTSLFNFIWEFSPQCQVSAPYTSRHYTMLLSPCCPIVEC